MTPTDFVRKWRKVDLTERSACQQHFLDLCELVRHPKPAEADPTGQEFCFERGADKLSGGEGWADVWKRGFFAFEYKGRRKDLLKAYQQLAQYRESLDNPPLLVVCDMDRIEVHTNFTGTAKRVYVVSLDTMTEPSSLDILRNVFHHPERLRPGTTDVAITAEAASKMAAIAVSLRARLLAQDQAATTQAITTEQAVEKIAGIGRQLVRSFDAHDVARFLDRLVFCLFAEDIELLPDRLFSKILKNARGQPDRFVSMVKQLFDTMAKGGEFGFDVVPYFNGNLFDDAKVLPLNEDEVEMVYQAAALNWASIDPSIFGTLFERGLDPDNRAMLGAHYTSRADIETLVDPVVMAPLLQEWEAIKSEIEPLIAKGGKKPREKADALAHGFLERLGKLRFLDPACGSGNFLYVTLQKAKDLEKSVNVYLNSVGMPSYLPVVGPWQFLGIETNPYAAELASMTLWIGYLQWTRANGYGIPDSPVLRKLDNITCDDSILRFDEGGKAYEPEWPTADFIVGNPPFLGDKLMKSQLGSDYVKALRGLYGERLPGQSDLCCYWLEKARAQIAAGKSRRAGLLATQGIRGGANREVLKRIKESGDIFFAVSDREWALDGANVHISIIGFDNGDDRSRLLDGQAVPQITPSLTSLADLSTARPLRENAEIAFIGTSMHGPFDFDEEAGLQMLMPAGNPTGKPNSDVVRPILNALEITRREARRWTVAFDPAMAWTVAAGYHRAAEFVKATVKPVRDENHRKAYRDRWWLHGEARPAMQAALRGLPRFLATPRVSKHRVFVWVSPEILPSDATVAFARHDDFFFGVLQSRFHEVWALKLGTRLETRPRYTPTTCFETFPLPPATAAQKAAIESVAIELYALRDRWLNPTEWMHQQTVEFPGSAEGPWARYIDTATVVANTGLGLVRYPRLEPKDASSAKMLKVRTLTKLYNERPTWLDNAHKALDAAVAAAYGWPADLTNDQVIERLLAMNLQQSK